ETVVEAVLARLPDRARSYRFLDLGTGTGCLLLALLSEFPRAMGVGVDIASGAASTARRNARLLGLGERAHFAVGDWAAAVAGGLFAAEIGLGQAAAVAPILTQQGLAIDGFAADLGGVIRCVVARR